MGGSGIAENVTAIITKIIIRNIGIKNEHRP